MKGRKRWDKITTTVAAISQQKTTDRRDSRIHMPVPLSMDRTTRTMVSQADSMDRIMVSRVDSMIRITDSRVDSMIRIMASRMDSTIRTMGSTASQMDSMASREIHTDRIMRIRI